MATKVFCARLPYMGFAFQGTATRVSRFTPCCHGDFAARVKTRTHDLAEYDAQSQTGHLLPPPKRAHIQFVAAPWHRSFQQAQTRFIPTHHTVPWRSPLVFPSPLCRRCSCCALRSAHGRTEDWQTIGVTGAASAGPWHGRPLAQGTPMRRRRSSRAQCIGRKTIRCCRCCFAATFEQS